MKTAYVIYSADERRKQLDEMSKVATRFYNGARLTNCHAFVEFAGLLTEYIKACERYHEAGKDFNMTNSHLGEIELLWHERKYILEKLQCIFGSGLNVPPPPCVTTKPCM